MEWLWATMRGRWSGLVNHSRPRRSLVGVVHVEEGEGTHCCSSVVAVARVLWIVDVVVRRRRRIGILLLLLVDDRSGRMPFFVAEVKIDIFKIIMRILVYVWILYSAQRQTM